MYSHSGKHKYSIYNIAKIVHPSQFKLYTTNLAVCTPTEFKTTLNGMVYTYLGKINVVSHFKMKRNPFSYNLELDRNYYQDILSLVFRLLNVL